MQAENAVLAANYAKVQEIIAEMDRLHERISTYRWNRTIYGSRTSWREHGQKIVRRHWLRWW
jgi:hypothetical protein